MQMKFSDVPIDSVLLVCEHLYHRKYSKGAVLAVPNLTIMAEAEKHDGTRVGVPVMGYLLCKEKCAKLQPREINALPVIWNGKALIRMGDLVHPPGTPTATATATGETKPMLSTFEQITKDINSVSEKELDRVQKRLRPVQPEYDLELGQVHNLEARKLFALVRRYASQESLAKHHSLYDADTDMEKELAHEEVHRWNSLRKLAKQIFWHQCRDDIGGSAWATGYVGVRENFMMVVRKGDSHHSHVAIAGLSPGAQQAIQGMLGGLTGMGGMGGMERDEDEETGEGDSD